jgi:hypothetical protein
MRCSLFAAPLLALSAIALNACGSAPAAPAETPTTLGSGAAATEARGGRAATTGVVYVTSQGLYYDTFATKDPLPMKGKFQKLVDGTTEWGPGDRQYLGGRWWVDLNNDGIQNAGDHFFLCPLLPPGRPTP